MVPRVGYAPKKAVSQRGCNLLVGWQFRLPRYLLGVPVILLLLLPTLLEGQGQVDTPCASLNDPCPARPVPTL